MHKSEFKRRFSIQTDRALADFLGITRGAVAQWRDGNVPELTVLRLRAKHPQKFRERRA